MGYKVELVPFDDQAKPDVGVANAANIIADKDILAGHRPPELGRRHPLLRGLQGVAARDDLPRQHQPRRHRPQLPRTSTACAAATTCRAWWAPSSRTVRRAKTAYVVHDKTSTARAWPSSSRPTRRRRASRCSASRAPRRSRTSTRSSRPIKAKNPDLIYFGGIYDQAAPFFKQAREKGVKAMFMGPDGMDSSDLTKIAGKAVVGMFYTSVGRPGVRCPRRSGLRRGVQEQVQARIRSRTRPQAYDADDHRR